MSTFPTPPVGFPCGSPSGLRMCNSWERYSERGCRNRDTIRKVEIYKVILSREKASAGCCIPASCLIVSWQPRQACSQSINPPSFIYLLQVLMKQFPCCIIIFPLSACQYTEREMKPASGTLPIMHKPTLSITETSSCLSVYTSGSVGIPVSTTVQEVVCINVCAWQIEQSNSLSATYLISKTVSQWINMLDTLSGIVVDGL